METLTKSFVAKLVAKSGREEDVAALLQAALPMAEAEPGTVAWFAVRADAQTFYIFDVFANERDRTAHIEGDIAATLMAKAPDLLASAPEILPTDVLAAKLPAA